MPPGSRNDKNATPPQESIKEALVNFELLDRVGFKQHPHSTATVSASDEEDPDQDDEFEPEDPGDISEDDNIDPYPLERWTCRKCGDTFDNIKKLSRRWDSFIRHMISHVSPYSCPCHGCKVESKYIWDAIDHFRCSHLSWDQREPFTCNINGCQMRFGRAQGLKQHKFGTKKKPAADHFMPDDPATHPLKLQCLPCNRFFPEGVFKSAHSKSCVEVVQKRLAQQRFSRMPIDGFEYQDFDGVEKAICPNCDRPVLSVIDLLIHLSDDHKKSCATRVQCHLCLDVLTVHESVFHYARCIASSFPDHIGKHMENRANALGLRRLFLVNGEPLGAQSRRFIGELLDLETSADPAALIQVYRKDVGVRRFMRENIGAPQENNVYAIICCRKGATLSWSTFFKSGAIVYVGSSYQLVQRSSEHLKTLSSWSQKYGAPANDEVYYMVKLALISESSTLVDCFHFGDMRRLEAIMVMGLGLTSLRNKMHPISAITLAHESRFHDFELSLLKIVAVTLYSTWEARFENGLSVDRKTVWELDLTETTQDIRGNSAISPSASSDGSRETSTNTSRNGCTMDLVGPKNSQELISIIDTFCDRYGRLHEEIIRKMQTNSRERVSEQTATSSKHAQEVLRSSSSQQTSTVYPKKSQPATVPVDSVNFKNTSCQRQSTILGWVSSSKSSPDAAVSTKSSDAIGVFDGSVNNTAAVLKKHKLFRKVSRSPSVTRVAGSQSSKRWCFLPSDTDEDDVHPSSAAAVKPPHISEKRRKVQQKRTAIDSDDFGCDGNGENFDMTLNPSRSRVAATAKRPVEVITLSDDDAHPVAPKTPELSTEVPRTSSPAPVPSFPDSAWDGMQLEYTNPNIEMSFDAEEEIRAPSTSTGTVRPRQSPARKATMRIGTICADIRSDDSGIILSP